MFVITGYIAHVLHKELDVAYMTYTFCFLFGFVILFASGFIFDAQGVQWVIFTCVCGSLPLYLIAEWLHKHFNFTVTTSKVPSTV